MAIDDFLNISYKMTSSDKFDDYMKALGVNLVTRKLANAQTPTITLKKEGDTYILFTQSTFKNSELKFKLDDEFDEDTMDGRKVKTTIKVEGDKLIQLQKSDGPDSTIIREFSPNELIATLIYKDVVCVRKYAKV